MFSSSRHQCHRKSIAVSKYLYIGGKRIVAEFIDNSGIKLHFPAWCGEPIPLPLPIFPLRRIETSPAKLAPAYPGRRKHTIEGVLQCFPRPVLFLATSLSQIIPEVKVPSTLVPRGNRCRAAIGDIGHPAVCLYQRLFKAACDRHDIVSQHSRGRKELFEHYQQVQGL